MAAMNIIDSDRHVVETNAMWKEYLPDELHRYIPYQEPSRTEPVNDEVEGIALLNYMIDGMPLLKLWNENRQIQLEAAKHSKSCISELSMATAPELQIKTMNESGVRCAFLFPTYATFIVNSEMVPSEISLAFADAYNRWLSDYCKDHPERLYGVGMISRHDPATLVKQLDKIIRLGMQSIILRPEMLFGRMLGHPDYEDFWKACEKLDISVAIHGGTHLQAPTIGTDRFVKHFSLHACSHPMEIQMAFLSLLESGVLERYPGLRFAFLEAGASWVPHWLWRLDEICYGSMPGEVQDVITIKPSEYFKRQCWVGFEIEEPCLRDVVDMVGIKRLLFGSDFPHPDHLQFTIQAFEENCSLKGDELVQVLQENAKSFFKSSFQS